MEQVAQLKSLSDTIEKLKVSSDFALQSSLHSGARHFWSSSEPGPMLDSNWGGGGREGRVLALEAHCLSANRRQILITKWIS